MTNPNNPVNPIDITYPDGTREICAGITKLEYFAGKAMEGLLVNSYMDYRDEDLASISIKLAKALITELNKEENGTD